MDLQDLRGRYLEGVALLAPGVSLNRAGSRAAKGQKIQSFCHIHGDLQQDTENRARRLSNFSALMATGRG